MGSLVKNGVGVIEIVVNNEVMLSSNEMKWLSTIKEKLNFQNQIIKKNLNTKLLTKSFGSCIHTKTIKQNWREGEGGGCSKD